MDYNATTPICLENFFDTSFLKENFANPSSTHFLGQKSKRLIEKTRQIIADYFDVSPFDVVFTSGGTEANNLAIKGAFSALGPETVILTSCVEHPSVLNTIFSLNCAYELLPVTEDGVICLQTLEKKLHFYRNKPLFISIMWANNETGALMPIEMIADLADRYKAVFHTDGIQAIGRLKANYQNKNIHLITASGHKMGGLPGCGFLIKRQEIKPLLYGGGQENTLRAGTENLLAIYSLKPIFEKIDILCAHHAELEQLRNRLEEKIKSITSSVVFFSQKAPRLCNTSYFAYPALSYEEQLIFLDMHQIAVSAGSACSSGRLTYSSVLKAMGVEKKLAQSSIRVSLGAHTTQNDIDYFLHIWQKMTSVIENTNDRG